MVGKRSREVSANEVHFKPSALWTGDNHVWACTRIGPVVGCSIVVFCSRRDGDWSLRWSRAGSFVYCSLESCVRLLFLDAARTSGDGTRQLFSFRFVDRGAAAGQLSDLCETALGRRATQKR